MARSTRGGTLPRFKATRARVQTMVLFLVIYGLEFVALTDRHTLTLLLGVAALLAVRRVAIALTLAVGFLLGGQFLWLSIGNGPRVSRTVIGNQVRTVRLLPIAVSGMFMPKEESFGRTHRIFSCLALLLPVALAGVVAPMLPAYAGLTLAVLTAVVFLINATSRDSVSGRSTAARILVAPTEHNDPMLTRSDRIRAARSACIDVHFGDLTQAQTVLDRLRAEPGAECGAALLAAELLSARGDFDAALRVRFPDPDPADTEAVAEAREATDSARAAKLLMLVAEKDPALAEKSVPLAQRHISAVARNPIAPLADRTGRALFALQAGDLQVARRENRICTLRARTPLAIADALCTRARIEALGGKPQLAAKALDEAEKFAPWYPRVTTVRQLAGAGAASAMPQPRLAAAQTDTSHVFAEPWSVSAPAAERTGD